MSKQKLTVYLEVRLHDLLILESAQVGRSLSNLSATMILDGLSKSSFLMSHERLSEICGVSAKQLESVTDYPLEWPDGYQWLAYFHKWIPLR